MTENTKKKASEKSDKTKKKKLVLRQNASKTATVTKEVTISKRTKNIKRMNQRKKSKVVKNFVCDF